MASTSFLFHDETIRAVAADVSKNVTMNNHQNGIDPASFQNNMALSSMFDMLSTNVDRKGRGFVSSMEAKFYPFYGVQFHPEKNNFEYGTYPGTDIPYEAIHHSSDAIAVSFYMAQLFVDEARRNTQHVYSGDVELFPSVWSYEMRSGVDFEQIFLIPNISTTKVEQYPLNADDVTRKNAIGKRGGEKKDLRKGTKVSLRASIG